VGQMMKMGVAADFSLQRGGKMDDLLHDDKFGITLTPDFAADK
jgi:hypothetical protein